MFPGDFPFVKFKRLLSAGKQLVAYSFFGMAGHF